MDQPRKMNGRAERILGWATLAFSGLLLIGPLANAAASFIMAALKLLILLALAIGIAWVASLVMGKLGLTVDLDPLWDWLSSLRDRARESLSSRCHPTTAEEESFDA